MCLGMADAQLDVEAAAEALLATLASLASQAML